MGWVYRRADQHHCELPNLAGLTAAAPGDIWQCGACSTYYVVRDSQRDGVYLAKATPQEVAAKVKPT